MADNGNGWKTYLISGFGAVVLALAGAVYSDLKAENVEVRRELSDIQTNGTVLARERIHALHSEMAMLRANTERQLEEIKAALVRIESQTSGAGR